MDKVEIYMQKAIEMGMEYGPKLLLAIVVLFVGLWIIGSITKFVGKVFERQNVDTTLRPFLTNLVTWILKALLLISVASMVGIETTSFVAVIGAAGLAVGLALQGSLANFAGGVLILIFRPFKTGDYIVAQGEEGIVDRIDVFATIVNRLDNQRVIIPNGPLAGGLIRNVTAEEKRRVDLTIGISYNDDIRKACKLLTEMCSKNSKVLNDPPPFVGVTDYGDSSINLTVRSWCKTSDYWDVFFEINEQMKYTLDEAGVSIPFPQRDVHIFNEK